MKKLKQLLLWLADGVWYAVPLVLLGCTTAIERRSLTFVPPIPEVMGQMEGRAGVAPPAPRPLTLLWSHTQENGDRYQVWRSEDLQKWDLVATITNQSWPIPIPPDAAFFKVRATNVFSHQVSDWATK